MEGLKKAEKREKKTVGRNLKKKEKDEGAAMMAQWIKELAIKAVTFVHSQDPHDRRRKLIPASWSLTSTCTPRYVQALTYTHTTHTHIDYGT